MKPSAPSLIRFFVKPYRWLFGGILVATLATSLLEGLNVAAFFPVFDSLLKSGESTLPGGFLNAMTALTRHLPFRDPVVAAMGLLLFITLLKGCFTLLRESWVAIASGAVSHDLRNRLMECYATTAYPFLLDSKQGKLIYYTSVGASRVGILAQKVTQWFAEAFKVLFIGLLLFLTLPLATGVIAAVGLGYQGLTHFLSKKISYHTGKGRVIAGSEQNSILNEFLSGIRQIVTFGTHPAWLKKFGTQSQIFRDLYIQDSIWLAVPKVLLELSVVFVLSGFILICRFFNPSTFAQSLPVIGVFAMALLRLLPSLTNLGQLRMEMLSSKSDAEAIHSVLTEFKPRPAPGQRVFTSLSKGIVFDSVCFAYPDREELLKGLQVTFEKGEVTAIVGPSGSGKTTIINLILGLFEPTQGRILIDGMDLREYPLDSWRRHIGFVSQDPFIVHASVAENITFGRTGYSDQAIQRAATIAQAHEFIIQLPQGYETLVGERGMKLSGGQQQRIAIARAILGNPEILIFDEATSSLDIESERSVQEAIEKVSRGRTVILIAHRLSTIQHADHIVVLSQGRIVEQGSREALLGQQGHYFQLVAHG